MMQRGLDPQPRPTRPATANARLEILWAVIAAVALGGLFFVPRDFWLVLSAVVYMVFVHALVWHCAKTGKKGMAWGGFLFFALPIDIGIVVAIIRTW
jgi:hypothetical protein